MNLPRRKSKADRKESGERLPPGQRVASPLPVMTHGATPRLDLKEWRFRVWGEVEEELTFTWEEFMTLPKATITVDVHCVTQWSTMDTTWEGVPFRELMKHICPKPGASYVMVHCHGGYTTNLSLEDLLDDGVLFAHKHGGRDLTRQHGWPLRLVVPKLYFWKSAKWVRGLRFMEGNRPGFWEMRGYHERGDPWKEERYS